MARNKRNNIFDMAVNRKKPSTPGNVPGGGGSRLPFIMGYNQGPQPGEGYSAPGWQGLGNYFWANPYDDLGWGNADWYEQHWPNWNIDNFSSFMDWWNNAPGAPGSGMDIHGYEDDAIDYYEWYQQNSSAWNAPGAPGSGGGNVGGPGDLSFGSAYSQNEELDCDFLGPQYDNNDNCYACCEGTTVPVDCSDGPVFNSAGECIECCGLGPVSPGGQGR